eukprot:CAMPEP_0171329694 /NCGR_PEP_ID=MMETSP0878-20121228/1474_1 /TAXON_ID=67004 /ORGANISM="Thalassiosira weissflogii, Strain CCMP1336" /LENGTH=662 /DNA_ID=CAMNT_0011829795 /DNA_START=214 /DNA_END=2202 /DNA_ORIENTATION=-
MSDGKEAKVSDANSKTIAKKDARKPSLDKARRKEVKTRLNSEARGEIRPLAIGTLAMMGSALSNQALPKLLGKLLDEKASSSSDLTCSVDETCSAASTGSASRALAMVVIGGGLASFLRTTMLNRAQDNIAKRLRTNLFRSVLINHDMEWFVCGGFSKEEEIKSNTKDSEIEAKKDESQDDLTSVSTSPGAIGTILTDDIAKASESITVTFANVLRSCSSCIFATYHMLSINPTLFGISVSIVPVVGAAAVVLNKFVKKATVKQRECAEQAASFAEERITHIEAVKLSNREGDEVDKYIELQERCVQLGRQVSVAKGSFMGFMFGASGAALYMVFSAGGRAISQGNMTSGELTSFATYSFLLGLGTSGVFKALGEYTQGLVSADRIFHLMDGTSDDTRKSCSTSSTSTSMDSVESITLESVSFAYRSQPAKPVLNNISLSLQRGKVVAVVGKNGSGKTTMASIIAGLYTPRQGKITLQPSGIDFNSLDRRHQTTMVQIVPQHPSLFDSSIRENVTYSNKDASEQEIQNALQLANCKEFISKLDGGLNFQVGRNGMRLSGGQRQRLALARALLCDPCLLILDEPTSAMDAEGEGAVTEAVHACRSGANGSSRGLLLITHRASTLQIADMIVVLKNGQMVESGTYKELTDRKDSELCELMSELV